MMHCMVDRALRRAMFCCRGYAAIICHRAAERTIHLVVHRHVSAQHEIDPLAMHGFVFVVSCKCWVKRARREPGRCA